MILFFNIAGVVYRVSADDRYLPVSWGKLSAHQVSESDFHMDLRVDVVAELPKPCGECVLIANDRIVYHCGSHVITYYGAVEGAVDDAYMRVDSIGNQLLAQVRASSLRESLTSRVLLEAMMLDHTLTSFDGFILHCSYIQYGDSAIVFTAPSGIGKSTQAKLWQDLRNAQIINGDRAAIRVGDYGFEVYGVPFSGSSEYCRNIRLPLKAVVCLSQAPNTTICRLDALRSFRKIWEGCAFYGASTNYLAKCSDTILDLISKVPIYSLACTPDESAVIALENILKQ